MPELKNDTTKTIDHQLRYNETVIAKIVGKTLADVPGFLSTEGNVLDNLTDRFRKDDNPTEGVKVDLDNDNRTAKLDLDATLEYGKSAPDIFKEAINKIQAAIEEMTDVKITDIKMTVKDLMTRSEWADKQKDTKSESDSENQ